MFFVNVSVYFFMSTFILRGTPATRRSAASPQRPKLRICRNGTYVHLAGCNDFIVKRTSSGLNGFVRSLIARPSL